MLTMEPETAVELIDVPVITLAHPLPGFPHDESFALTRLDEEGVLFGFRSLSGTGLEFVVVPPGQFYPEYAPEISDDVVADLGIVDADDVLVFVLVRAGATLADTTVNLRAPIVLNTVNQLAAQVILDDPEQPIAAPLVAAPVR